MTKNHQLFSAFLAHCARSSQSGNPALNNGISAAISARHKAKADLEMGHKHLVLDLGLNWKSERQEVARNQHLDRIGEVLLERLKIPYPPMNHWVVESPEIGDMWYKHIYESPQPDDRLARHPFHYLDPAKLKLIVDPEKSVIIRDKRTKELALVVIRNACPDESAPIAIDAVVSDAVNLKKSIRLEDPGSIVQIGYSAGARHKPFFDWVRNITSKSTDTYDLNKRTSSAFAFFWNLCRAWLPEEIITDIDAWLTRTQAPAMDATRQFDSHEGSYDLIVDGIPFQFTDVCLAPPCGVMARNYARAIHREQQPHKYAISWTTSRNKGQEYGGAFYLAKYGIQVTAAANTFIAWKNHDAHGTGLQKINPGSVDDDEDPNSFCQAGLAFVTPNRLQKVWEQCLQGIADGSRVWEVLVEGDEETEIEYNWECEDDDDEIEYNWEPEDEIED
ncbi:hypothetical protein F5887DRAFT_1084600 [Amanita rubescens]|nr:hypothetical protein F5887DRAFT_1084600 [Amanita rubescens]